MESQSRPWHRHWPTGIPRSIPYPDVPATWLLERNLDRHADRVAIRDLDHATGAERMALTYGDLHQAARRVATSLKRHGARPGDRVGFYLPNCPSIVATYFGTWLVGAVGVPCNPMYRVSELRHALEDSGASVLITSAGLLTTAQAVAADLGLALMTVSDDAAELVEVSSGPAAGGHESDASDAALILYTGGTTGEPKGATLTHRNLVANALQFSTWYRFEEAGETCVSVLPLSHSGGMAGAMTVPILAGATLLLFQRFNAPIVARAVQEYRATRFFGVPTMYIAMLSSHEARRADLSSLRACRTNAAPLPPAVKEAFDRLVGHEVLIEGYGLTETSPLTHANPVDRAKAGSIGIPLPDTDATIVDPQTGGQVPSGQQGELLLRGPQVMRGYWHKPAETAAVLDGGWLRTGDIVTMDDDGYFFVVDRKKDMINTGGYKAWPREIEDVLYQHPAVALAAVVGVPDDYLGERVKAYVVLRQGATGQVTSEDLIAHCKARLASFKIPRVIEFRPNLPLSGAGKVLRRELRAEAQLESR